MRHNLLMRTIGTLAVEDQSYYMANVLCLAITLLALASWALESVFYFLYHEKVECKKKIMSLDNNKRPFQFHPWIKIVMD